MQSLNVYNGTANALPIIMWPSGGWLDIGLAYAFAMYVHNTTGADIDSGVIEFEGADPLPNNPCAPGPFSPIQPIEDCGPIVTGHPYDPPVRLELADRPIAAGRICGFSFPCPPQFVRISNAPAGVNVVGVLTRLRRTNFDHYGPWGGIPQPLPSPTP